MMFMDQNLEEFIGNVNSRELPGGGSVSCLTAILGSGLSNMSFYLTEDKKIYKNLDDETKAKIKANIEKLDSIIEELKEKMVEDTTSFDSVLKAFKLPKDTEEEKAIRKKEIDEGYLIATQSPLSAARIMLEALECVADIAQYIDKYAVSDNYAGALILNASIKSVLLNAKINMRSMDSNKELEDEIKSIEKRSEELLEKVAKISMDKIGEI
ncbi:MAG: cyclodeaminase/cyclohydrolase family protein [Finegoldia sp.]|nr:cyclodeaminase/cyclohydrolase family protein [Finegoldia sp.]